MKRVIACIVLAGLLAGIAWAGDVFANAGEVKMTCVYAPKARAQEMKDPWTGTLVSNTVTVKMAGKAETKAPRFGVYLVKDAGTELGAVEKKAIGGLKLEEKPLITENDITLYDWKRQTITLKKGMSVVPKQTLMKYFVVTVEGERVYVGAFVSTISSYAPGVPVVMVDAEGKLGKETHIEPPPFADNRDGGRGDERILKALEKLGKLAAPDALPLERGKEEAWGEAVKGLRWRVWMETEEVEIGGSGTVNFEFQNVSGKELRIYKEAERGPGEGPMYPAFVHADGSRNAYSGELQETAAVKAEETVTLKPKEAYRTKWKIPEEGFTAAFQPGRVEMKLRYFSPKNTNAEVKDFWEGDLRMTVVFRAMKPKGVEAVETMEQVAARVKKVLGAGWTTKVEAESITIGREEEVEWTNKDLMRRGSVEDLRRKGFVRKGQYEMVLICQPAMKADAVERLRKENEATKKQLDELTPKMKGFMVLGEYSPRTREDIDLLKEYLQLKGALHQLPDVTRGKISVSVKVVIRGAGPDVRYFDVEREAALPDPWVLADKEVEKECLEVQAKVLGELEGGGEAK